MARGVLILAWMLWGISPALAQVRFTGATIGLSAQAGPAILNDDRPEGRTGLTAGLAGRLTGAMFLADVEVGYHVSRFGSSAGGVPFELMRHSFSVTVGLHPLFITLLGNKRLHYVLGGFHVDVGASLEVSSVSVSGDRRSRGDPAWHWGGGLEIPVSNPEEGRALWLGVLFRQIRVRSDIVPSLATDLGDTQLLFTLAYRWNWK